MIAEDRVRGLDEDDVLTDDMFSPLPDMPTLGSSNLAANKDMMKTRGP